MTENQLPSTATQQASDWTNFEQESSQIATAKYSAELQALRIAFKKGGEYHYDQVPAEVWEAYKAASSVGSFFHAAIKGRYPSTKIS